MMKRCRKISWNMLWAWLGCVGMAWLAGCAASPYPGYAQRATVSPPTLSDLAVAPNPTYPGGIVNLTVSYVDEAADLERGVAVVSVNGTDLSRIAFRATYVSGVLTIPLPVSYYARSSDVQIALRIRDSAGDWSNLVSTVLAIR